MNFAEGLLLVLFIFPAACLTGYSSVGLLATLSAGVRMCLASLAGLAIWLWLVACLNIWLPINFWVAWSIIGASWLGTSLLPYARRALLADGRALFASTGCRWLVLAPLPLIAGMLLPMVMHRGLVFHDGTSNHDSFFWIIAAEWLQQHTYLASPNPALDPAVFSVSGTITGVSPAWGRMGTEGLLALLASALNLTPLSVYVYVQVGLLPLWLASTVVFVRLVLAKNFPAWVFCLGASLQPLFVFFITNNSMPNLLGALVAPALLVAFVRLTETTGLARFERPGWGGVAALMLHGLLCSYPEMAPFVLFAAGGAVGAKLCRIDRRGWRARLMAGIVSAGVAGLLIQPLTAWRACGGFWNSLTVARADAIWGNIFAPLNPGEYIPALTTLNVPACGQLGPGLGWALSLLLVITLILVVRRAQDKATALAGLSGFILLISYTLVTDFSYGWQKATQFSGVIVAGYFTFGSFVALAPVAGLRASVLRYAGIAILAVFMAYATIWGCARNYYWAENKALDRSFLALKNLSDGELRHQPVEVVGATFDRPFFYTMWAVYALPYSYLSFDARGGQRGGYLSGHLPVFNPGSPEAVKPQAYLVSRAWADTFDADSIRLSSGPHHALLTQTNKVMAQNGVYPMTGVPQIARASFSFTLLPYADGVFEMEIALRQTDRSMAAPLVISYGDPAHPEAGQTIKSRIPGIVRLPIRGGEKCQINVVATMAGREAYPLELSRLRLTHQ